MKKHAPQLPKTRTPKFCHQFGQSNEEDDQQSTTRSSRLAEAADGRWKKPFAILELVVLVVDIDMTFVRDIYFDDSLNR